MSDYVRPLQDLDATQVTLVGGKGANLGELSRIEGIRVPPGFCVTTDAYQLLIEGLPLGDALGRLAKVAPGDRDLVAAVSAEIRASMENAVMPDAVATEITAALAALGEHDAYAVRSSATAEDLPGASFAGQQDSYLNVIGPAAVIDHVRRCWASLFTERAVTYRLQQGVDQRRVHMAVVVQQMVVPQVAGVLFTADPVTGNRKDTSIEASFGLGEALVSGLVSPDIYTVRDGRISRRVVGTKQTAIQPSLAGGVQREEVTQDTQAEPALTDSQVVRLADLGRRIETHFGRPQDVEWCLVDDVFVFVQTRPITTLFPTPAVTDGQTHVYLSVGHQQMMTDPMRPLGLSFWQMTTPRPMAEAGGRLFVDITGVLTAPTSRDGLLEMAARSDPLMRDALETVIDRGDIVPAVLEAEADKRSATPSGTAPGVVPAPIETDPAIVTELIARNQASVAALERGIASMSGPDLIDFIVADIQELRRLLFDPNSNRVWMSAMEATWWLNEHAEAWLGEKNVADTLTRSVPHNVTSEMGLALLDVADAIRPYPEVVTYLEDVADEGFLEDLPNLAGGQAAHDAIRAWLAAYGMRCVGEIDITRARWSERPTMLLPMILSNVRSFEAGASERRFEQGRHEARNKEQELLDRLRALPDGDQKAEETKQRIDRVRAFIGYREYPKYGMVSRYFVYKRALMREADRLVAAGILRTREDIFFLTFDDVRDVVRTGRVDEELVRERREAFRWFETLTPPRVLTSDGEAIAGMYRREDVSAGALVGLAVSAGTVEGRARVILDMADADLERGDILVTTATDPSWTPLFVAIAGLVTEVGGLMTHGAVIAREYGLPAVVGVEHATQLIQDGQMIRVHGTEGYVEVLSPASSDG